MSEVGSHSAVERLNVKEQTMYHGERRVSYGIIAIVLIGLLVAGGAFFIGKSSSPIPVVVIVTATPIPLTNSTVQASAVPLVSACLVPNVVGQDQGTAEGLIAGTGLQSVKSTAYDPSVPAGGVISQDPPSGTERNPCQGKVTIVVSLGSIPPTASPIPTATPTVTPILPTANSTVTPIPPTATPILPTIPGTVLRDGETWYADGWSLTVSNFTYKTTHKIKFTIRNRIGRLVLFPFKINEFKLTSDAGDEIAYPNGCAGGNPFDQQIEIPADGTYEWNAGFTPSTSNPSGCYSGSPADFSPQARRLTLSINISDIIKDAKWETEIPRL